jgi:hypothetical protein
MNVGDGDAGQGSRGGHATRIQQQVAARQAIGQFLAHGGFSLETLRQAERQGFVQRPAEKKPTEAVHII